MRRIILLLAIISLLICACSQENKNSIKGSWAYILSEKIYYEVYINDNKISFYSDNGINIGPLNYKLKKDSIFFSDMVYSIKLKDCNSMVWINKNLTLELEQICIPGHIDSCNYDPFYLRRCNYLVSKGLISMKEALNYLSKLQDEIEIKEEFIQLKRK